MSNLGYQGIYPEHVFASNSNVSNTLTADNIVSNNIVGPFGPITGLVSYSTATVSSTIPTGGQTFVDINNISNPGGVILASNFTNGSIFEAYYGGIFSHVSAGFISQVRFGLSFNTVDGSDKRFGHTQVNSINRPATTDIQTFEYRCTFRVASYTNSTTTIAFVTSGRITTSAIAASDQSVSELNQVSGDGFPITTKDRTLDGNINLAFYVDNSSGTNINFSRYTSYIKRIV